MLIGIFTDFVAQCAIRSHLKTTGFGACMYICIAGPSEYDRDAFLILFSLYTEFVT